MSSLLQEFKKFCGNLSMEQVNAAFKAFDISGDNQLDYDEFCKLMNNRRAGTMIIPKSQVRALSIGLLLPLQGQEEESQERGGEEEEGGGETEEAPA